VTGVRYSVTPAHWLAHRLKRHCAISMPIIFFLGADGFDPHVGMMAHSFLESHVNGAMVWASRKVVAVCDSTKFNRKGLAMIVYASAVHTVITDTGISPADMEALQNADIEVITV
jgi:DeoR family transcriptional regulator, aga operon transcriptional repressor